MALSNSYQPVQTEDTVFKIEDFDSVHITRAKPKNIFLFGFILIASNAITIIISRYLLLGTIASPEDPQTPFACLKRDLAVPFMESSPYTDPNQTISTKLWEEINIDAGMVALPDDLSKSHGLKGAQRFPWDRSRGIYLLNGHHNLHCIRAIYLSLQEFKRGSEQSRSWGHVLHCADSIRQDIICNADDMPRYSTESLRPESGIGQIRMCRSWEKLEKWASEYNSCYAYVNQTSETLPELQRFLYCPVGSPWREKVVETFGKGVPMYEDL